ERVRARGGRPDLPGPAHVEIVGREVGRGRLAAPEEIQNRIGAGEGARLGGKAEAPEVFALEAAAAGGAVDGVGQRGPASVGESQQGGFLGGKNPLAPPRRGGGLGGVEAGGGGLPHRAPAFGRQQAGPATAGRRVGDSAAGQPAGPGGGRRADGRAG